jgi:hypothetical protein
LHVWFLVHIAAATQGKCAGFAILKFVAELAGSYLPMAPDAERMSRMRAAEKEARRAAVRQAQEREARKNVAPVVIRFPVDTACRRDPAARARQCAARREAQKVEADRAAAALAVTTAADAFMRAISAVSDAFARHEAQGLGLSWMVATYDAHGLHPIISILRPPAPVPASDASGRAFVVAKLAADGAPCCRHDRRTRALARLTERERRAFVAAIRAHPAATVRAAREAREAFATGLRAARARDDAMMAAGQSREAEYNG